MKTPAYMSTKTKRERPASDGKTTETSTDRVEALVQRLRTNPHLAQDFGDEMAIFRRDLPDVTLQELPDWLKGPVMWGYLLAVHHILCPDVDWQECRECSLYRHLAAALDIEE